jgi:hypothetical protein
VDLDLSPEEVEILKTIRRMSENLGTHATSDAWWDILKSTGFVDIRVIDGASALQATCVAEALGEAISPVGFPAVIAAATVLTRAGERGDVPVVGSAMSAWHAGGLGQVGLGHELSAGHGIIEAANPGVRYALVHVADGWLLLGDDQFVQGGPNSWTGAPVSIRISWDVGLQEAVLVAPGSHDLHELNLLLHTAELVGVMRATVRRTLPYLRQREQFGRPIGSFQALQHRAVDVVTDLCACEALTEFAAWRWANDDQDEDRGVWAHVAAGVVAEASLSTMRECLQFHGGIAMTAEFWLHHWLRRAARLATFQGSAHYHFGVVGGAMLRGVRLAVPLS